MNRKTICVVTAVLTSFLGAGTTFAASQADQSQISKDKSADKAASGQVSADTQDAKRLTVEAGQADAKKRASYKTWQEKIAARKAAPKDKVPEALKEEASAKEAFSAADKEDHDIQMQRKAALNKLHGADMSYKSDADKTVKDEDAGKKSHAKPKNTSTQ